MVCVVTGAGGNVGGALVNSLRSSGATVVAIHRGPSSSIMKTRQGLYTVKTDLSDENTVRVLVREIISLTGPIHAWINAAGGFHMGESIEDATLDIWKQMLSVNFITALNSSRAVLPSMKKNRFGRIINFGSFPGEDGMANAAPYAVSKAAVHTLTKTIWQENHAYGVSAHAIIPTTIDTPANREAMPDEDWSEWVTTKDISNKIIDLILTPGIDRKPEEIIIPLRGSGGAIGSSSVPSELLDIFDRQDTQDPIPENFDIPTTQSTDVEPSFKPDDKKDTDHAVPEVDTTPITPEYTPPPQPDFLVEDEESETEDILQDDFVQPDAMAEDLTLDDDEPFIIGEKDEVVPSFIQKIRDQSQEDIEDETPDISESEQEEENVEGLADAVATAGKKLTEIFKQSSVEDESPQKDDSDKIAPDMASFEMVEHLKIRQQYDKALAMLAIMEENGAPESRIREERDEISELMYHGDDGEMEEEEKDSSPDDDVVDTPPVDDDNQEEDMDLAGYLDRITTENLSGSDDLKKKD